MSAGVLLGVGYAASPFTLWFVAAAAGLVWWTTRGLVGAERRWITAILVAALALRALAVAVLFLSSAPDHLISFFWDGDGVYLKQRGLWIRNVWLGIPIFQVHFLNAFQREYGWTTYLFLLAYLQYLVGPAPYGVHLLNVALFAATAGLLYRLARSAYGPHAAMLGLLILLFLPTPFLWSVSALKESLYMYLVALAMVTMIALFRSRKAVEHLTAAAVFAAALLANSTVRAGALTITSAGLLAGVVGSVVVRRVSLLLLALLLLPIAACRVWSDPALHGRLMAQIRTASQYHIGHVRTQGHSYKLLDQRFYSSDHLKTPEALASMTKAEATRFAVRALVGFVAVPLPWQVASASEMVFFPQQLLWYGLVILAVAGFVAGLQRDPLVTCILAGLACSAGAAIALNSGNIGTMVRHRDIVVPSLVWLSALGAVTVISKLGPK